MEVSSSEAPQAARPSRIMMISEGEIRLLNEDLNNLSKLIVGLTKDFEKLQDHLVGTSMMEDQSITAKSWMTQVRQLYYDTGDYLYDFIHSGKEFKVFKARAEDASERLERQRIQTKPPSMPMVRRLPAPPRVDLFDMVGEVSSLMGSDEKLKVISIVGPECVGKTTLAKKLYSNYICGSGSGTLHCWAFLRVSAKPDMLRLLTSMFIQIQRKQPSRRLNVHDLLDSIAGYLQDKRYFIVIDDLWTEDVWGIISRAFPSGDYCSRVIITTQVKGVALACCGHKSEYVFTMEPLSVAQSEKLFIQTVFVSESGCPEDLKDVSDGIIRKCGGLPLAIINIASMLPSTLNLEEWTGTRDSLPSTWSTNPSSEWIKELANLLYSTLAPHLKTCLLYFSMYAEGYIVRKDDLIKQWVVEGVLDGIEGQATEVVAEDYFDELVKRGMIQTVDTNKKGEVLSGTLHRMMHDVVVNESMKQNFVNVVYHFQSSIGLPEKVRRLSVQFGGARSAYVPDSLVVSNVRSLAFFGLFQCLPSIDEYGLLRVLNLHIWADQDKNSAIDLTGIRGLLRLRYLKIACNIAVILPDNIHGQQYLEILEVDATVADIPWDIGELSRLRILKFAVSELSSEDICVLQELVALSALSVYVKTVPAECIVFGKGGFCDLKFFTFRCSAPLLLIEENAMPKIEKLNICFNAQEAHEDATKPITIEHLPSLKEISANIGGAVADVGSALMTSVTNDVRNPTPTVQLMESRQDQEHGTLEEQDEIMEEEAREYPGTEDDSSEELESMAEDESECSGTIDDASEGCDIMDEDHEETSPIRVDGSGKDVKIEDAVADTGSALMNAVTNDVINPSPIVQFMESRQDQDQDHGSLEENDEIMEEEEHEYSARKKGSVECKSTEVETQDYDSGKEENKNADSRTSMLNGPSSRLLVPVAAVKWGISTAGWILSHLFTRLRTWIPTLSEPSSPIISKSSSPMQSESSPRLLVPVAEVGWGIATAGWILSPVFTRLIDKALSHVELGESKDDFSNLVAEIIPRLKHTLEVAESNNDKVFFEKLVRELKSNYYELEETLDEVEYDRLDAEPNKSEHASIDHAGPSKQSVVIESSQRLPESVEKRLKENLYKIEQALKEANANIKLEELSSNITTKSGKEIKDRSKTTFGEPRVKVIGRGKQIKKITELLHDRWEPCSVIGICGIAGSGKTTIAQHVYRSEKKTDNFELFMWIHVSRNFSVGDIYREMLQQVRGNGNQYNGYESVEEIRAELKENLHRGRFLLVLDDIWCDKESDKHKLYELFSLLPKDDYYQNKVLVTSRNKNAISSIGPDVEHTTVEIQDLSEKVFCNLFMYHALRGKKEIESMVKGSLTEIGLHIAKRLNRSPLAAALVGGLLRKEMAVDHWISVKDDPYLLKGITGILWLCYQHLDEEAKRCFAYCSIFPRRHRFECDELVRLWMSEGFIEATDAGKMEEIGKDYFFRLVSVSFMQLGEKNSNGGKEYFTVHDLLHDIAQQVAGNDIFRIEDGWRGKIPLDVRHLFVQTSYRFLMQNVLKLEKLRSLIIINGENSVRSEEVFEYMLIRNKRLRKLRVLVIRTTTSIRHYTLPASIGDFKHMRYLAFWYRFECAIRLPDAFTKLYHLQVLEFGGRCKISHHGDISKLINLRHLMLQCKLKNIDRLTSLETLPFFKTDNQAGYELSQLRHLDKLRGKLHIVDLEKVKTMKEALDAKLADKEGLRELVLEWKYLGYGETRGLQMPVLEALCPSEHLEEIKIIKYIGERYPDWMVGDQQRSWRVQRLVIKECSPLPAIPESSPSFFSNLLQLSFQDCNWVSLPDNMEHLKKLTVLIIYRCREIKLLGELPRSLKYLEICECGYLLLASLRQRDHPKWEKIQHIERKFIGCATLQDSSQYPDEHGVFSPDATLPEKDSDDDM